MALARKPKAKPAQKDEKSIEELINRGGGVPSEAPALQYGAGEGALVRVSLRLPKDLADQIETAVESRAIRTPRHTWILEAIHEKLEREAGN